MIRHWDERKKFKKTRDEMVGNLKLKRIIIRSTHVFLNKHRNNAFGAEYRAWTIIIAISLD